MNINDLLQEAQFSQPIYAYHATDGANLKSILKHGMIPNHLENGYGSNETSSMGYSLAPQSGVYFTKSHGDAIHIAKSIETKVPVIIVCKIQIRDADMDEDRLTAEVIKERELGKKIGAFIRQHFESIDSNESTDELITNFAVEEADKILDNLNLNNNDYINNVRPHLINYITALVNYQVGIEMESAFDASDELKHYQGVLTKKLRKFAKSNTVHGDTFKLDKKIGFSGASKIVGVFLMNNGSNGVSWGDVGRLTGFSYHRYDSPMALVDKI